MTGAAATAPARSEPPGTRVRAGSRLTRVVAGLTLVNILGSATGFITGPLLARALGASGRGDLQAIVVPLSLVPGVLGFGIPAYAYRTLPRGQPIGEVMGSLGLPLIAVGLIAAAAGVPLADALAAGRSTVRLFLIVVFLSTPLILLGSLLVSGMSALQRWPNVMAMSLMPFMVSLLGIGTMYVLGDLTVATAAVATIAGSLLAVAPGLPLILRTRPVFRKSMASAGIGFGARSWIGGLAQMSNARLDQLLMITAVSPRELGLYAVATTLAGASGLAAGALSPPLMARIAAGEVHLMAQAVRIIVEASVCLNIVLALAAPVILSVLFGRQFRGAVPMAWILLVAQVPLCGASVLSSALQADGAPLIPTVAEGIALVITVVGLITLLGPLEAIGAAIVSLAAYSTSFVFQIAKAHRRIGVPFSEFFVPRRDDLRWAWGRFGELARRLRAVVGQP